jgi:hypothetical protein
MVSGHKQAIMNDVIRGFTQCIQENARIILQIRPRPLSSIYDPIYFLVILLFDVMYPSGKAQYIIEGRGVRAGFYGPPLIHTYPSGTDIVATETMKIGLKSSGLKSTSK